MKRFHVHVAVDDLTQSTRFYSALFGAEPSVEKPDYAKWMLDDPHINFAISHRGSKRGVNHLGFQVDTDEELSGLQTRHEAAELSVLNEGNTQCCYAKSKKHWVTDPQGVAWEMYRSMGEVQTYHGEADDKPATPTTPTTAAQPAPAATCATSCRPAAAAM